MPDLVKMMTDKTTYPDDLTIEVHGEKMTMKEWRDGLGLKQEFHKHTEKLSGEKKQLEAAMQEREGQLQQLQGQLAQAMARRGVNPAEAQDDDLSAYRSDPAFGPLVKLIDKQQQTMGQLAQRMQMDEIAVNSWRYDSQLKRLKEQDTDLDTQALAKYTSDLYSRGPDVETAYRLFTEEKRLKKQVAEAEQRGYDKAKAEPPAPPMPGGRRGNAGKAPLELPKDLNARMQLALQDPEIQALMTSE
jgi:hypothetical protein